LLVTVADIEARTATVYAGAELARVNAAIADVSALITDYCRRVFTDPVPAGVVAVAAMEVRRVLNTEPGIATERVADLSSGFAYGGSAVALSPDAMRALDRYMRSLRSGIGIIQLIRPEDWDAAVLANPTTPTLP
jgi:hypothetical protein